MPRGGLPSAYSTFIRQPRYGSTIPDGAIFSTNCCSSHESAPRRMSSTGRVSRSDARAHPCAISPASTPRSSASYVISLRSGNHAATQRTRAIH